MRHCRIDYEAIQPFPQRRPHHVKIDGQTVMEPDVPLGVNMDPIIPEDEPVFIIRARDLGGPSTVEAWCNIQSSLGADPDLVRRVWRWAQEMREYGEANGQKIPDTPPELLRP